MGIIPVLIVSMNTFALSVYPRLCKSNLALSSTKKLTCSSFANPFSIPGPESTCSRYIN